MLCQIVVAPNSKISHFKAAFFHGTVAGRVGPHVLFRSERSVLLKNATSFSILFLSFWRLMKLKRTICSILFFS